MHNDCRLTIMNGTYIDDHLLFSDFRLPSDSGDINGKQNTQVGEHKKPLTLMRSSSVMTIILALTISYGNR
jgi:hypothetical protein